ncbi:MAG TPA: hypothetical protein PKL92_00495 [Aquaticitalea sp.]|mgnify:CR=1 FL=1|nr:hypothetical protein [Aquaticitalea sp.]HNU59100.1 hypothetical protein [Aquaticitalea sp.]
MHLKKVLLAIVPIIFCLFSCKNKTSDFWNNAQLEETNAYIAYRGTETKQGFFARDFNLKDTLSSHVGILLYDEDNWLVFNVSDFKDGGSDFRKQNIRDFYGLAEEKINSASLWRIDLDSTEVMKLKMLIHTYESRFINFDRYFTLNDSTKLYCSQFVKDVLVQTDSSNFHFEPVKRALGGIYKSYFRKDTLEYYPVDLFQSNDRIKKIGEWTFK